MGPKYVFFTLSLVSHIIHQESGIPPVPPLREDNWLSRHGLDGRLGAMKECRKLICKSNYLRDVFLLFELAWPWNSNPVKVEEILRHPSSCSVPRRTATIHRPLVFSLHSSTFPYRIPIRDPHLLYTWFSCPAVRDIVSIYHGMTCKLNPYSVTWILNVGSSEPV